MEQPQKKGHQGIRWWPALLILLGGAGRVLWIWWAEADQRQDQVLGTESVLIIGVLLLLLWLGFLSRLAWRRRLGALLFVGLLVAGFAASFRYVGVSGDLVPLFEARWTSRADAQASRTWDAGAPRGDFPRFLGQGGEGRVRAVKLAHDWQAHPPRLIWRRAVGAGWSGFAVQGDRAVTQEQEGQEDRVVCYELATGHVSWNHADPVSYRNGIAGDGPRATPTIQDGRVFSMGSTGILNALDLASGQKLWAHNVCAEFRTEIPAFGISGSPLVLDGKVIVSVGGQEQASLLAFDARTGQQLWKAGRDRAGYASPFVTTLAGTRQIIILNNASVVGHDPKDGHVIWSQPWTDRSPNVAQPLPIGKDRLLVSCGYGVGSKLFELRPAGAGRLAAQVVWQSKRLKSKFANMILHAGHVFGLDDGILTCIDASTGRRRWKAGRYGHGQLLLVGDVLLVQTETGAIVLVALDTERHRELAHYQVLKGKLWNPPALAGSLLLVRNEREAALVQLPWIP